MLNDRLNSTMLQHHRMAEFERDFWDHLVWLPCSRRAIFRVLQRAMSIHINVFVSSKFRKNFMRNPNTHIFYHIPSQLSCFLQYKNSWIIFACKKKKAFTLKSTLLSWIFKMSGISINRRIYYTHGTLYFVNVFLC